NPLPINLHAAWTLKALAAGKHVLCEKPFAMNAGEAAAMIAAGEQHGRRVIEAFHYRYHPAFARLIEWLRGGELGAIKSIEAHFNAPIANVGGEIRHQVETGGGAMMDLGCYCLHQILSVMNTKPVTIRAQARLTPQGVDETMQATLTFAGGVTASIHTSMSDEFARASQIKIVCDEGEVTLTNSVTPHDRGALTVTRGDDRLGEPMSPITTYDWQLAAVERALRSGDRLPTEGAVIQRQQDMLDEIYTAADLRHLRYQ
ncbi:MAG: Gfo/Idh/MocA family oxidoreductase, partial [Pseudomonadota bacterium]